MTWRAKLVNLAGPLGLYTVAWRLTRWRPRIFMYHRFAATDTNQALGRDTFRAQIKLLKRRCRIITMRELAEVLKSDPQAATGLAVVTADDGYRDFYEHAWPVLKEEGVPATFFPVTGFVDGDTWLWPDLVEHALATLGNREFSAGDIGLPGAEHWSLHNSAERQNAWQALIDHAIDLPDNEKWAFLRTLYRELGLLWPTTLPEQYAPVSWDQLRQLAENGIEIGAHTRTHCRLTRVDDRQLLAELAGAKQRLEKQLDRAVVSLCYPNGMPADYDARVVAAVQRAGYSSAVVAHFDGQQGGIYDLRRHGAGTDLSQFHKQCVGVDDIVHLLRSSRH